ncbi:MAG TPA: L-threonylcarbamoyladenylate synthase [Limnobacter sp.]|nr:L-threonylcarbamoyladenylate synthase [Limnobacter sp.]
MTTDNGAPIHAAVMHAALLSPSPANLQRCANALRQGDLVAFPTETVFGLGAAVDQPAAVAGIFKAKGRPADHPLIAHAAPGFDWAAGWIRFNSSLQQQQFEALTRAFWPGPLTLVLPRGNRMPLQVTGGQDSVGVRCPSHPVAMALLEATDVPVAAPSANRFGKVSPTRAVHVMAELGDRILWVLDGNIPDVGIESTIVSLLEPTPRILRPGAVTAAQLKHALGQSVQGFTQSSARKDNPRVSGALEKHYSPDAKVLVLDAPALNGFVPQGNSLCVGWSDGFLTQADALRTRHGDLVMVEALANTPQEVAKNLYAALRQADALQCTQVVFEQPANGEEWEGVADRLKRASA